MRPRTSVASQKITSQNHTQKSPISLSVILDLKPPHRQIPILSGMCPCGFQRCHLFAAALSFRACGCCSQSPRGSPGSVCPAVLNESQRLEPSGACIPVQDSASRNRSPTIWGLSPWWAWHVLLSMRGVRPRDPEHLSAPKTKHQEPRGQVSPCRLF